MSMLVNIISPFNLLFLIIIIGFAIGKLRVQRISLGIAGVLFSGLLVGFLVNLLLGEMGAEIISNVQAIMKTTSTLGSSLFVSVIGIQTGFSLKGNSKQSLIALFIGALMSLSGVATMLIISSLDDMINYASLLGILCGALTSTPGLSSVCEKISVGTEEAIFSYGCSYLFGVVFVVLLSQLVSRNLPQEKPSVTNTENCAVNKKHFDFFLISIVSLLGSLLGNITIPFLNISIGNMGGMLLVGLFIGYLMKRNWCHVGISSQILDTFRNIGLSLFFSGTGFVTGTQRISFSIKTVIYGIIITSVATLCGWILCKLFNSRYNLHTGYIIAGGMTSSPAFGSIGGGRHESRTNCFAFSYFGALITLIISIQVFLI